ncbi:MAG: hypothetical protein K0S61_311 [Anaerocolumna sp.]|nr:hypothetical protein [Anaerocolumna sp.]
MANEIIKMISSIPKFQTQYNKFYDLDNDFLKEKLIQSETNKAIYRLARGEGSKKVLNKILDPDILFDWGMKSNHSRHIKVDVRNELNPGNASSKYLLELTSRFQEDINKQKSKYDHIEGTVDIVELMKKATNYEERKILKEFYISYLHTAGSDKEFNTYKPWISTSYGANRLSLASRFGKNTKNKTYIILDYWVNRKSTYQYIKTFKIIRILNKLGLKWHSDINKEIMVRYALFPQNLVGYYYFQNDELQYYYFNHHYIDQWYIDKSFSIGNRLYIPQPHVDFPKTEENPYNIIYLNSGYTIEIFNEM